MRRKPNSNEPKNGSARLLLHGHIPMAAQVQLLAVAEYRSFRRAAQALGIDQPSISLRIKLLEQHLDIVFSIAIRAACS